jgi:hypothetical protein
LRAALGLGALLSTATLFAQVTATAPAASGSEAVQRFDFYGGAAYAHFNPGYAHQVAATNLIGAQGSATAWFTHAFGAEATWRGVYGNYPIPANLYGVTGKSNIAENLFLFGPSARLYSSDKYTAGVHLLIGGTYGSFDSGFKGSGIQPFSVGVYNNELTFAAAFGGWADYNLGPKYAVRFIADYQPTFFGNTHQNEFGGSLGFVYKFGTRGGK